MISGFVNVCCDSHHAQCNIHIEPMSTNRNPGRRLDFRFIVNNPDLKREVETLVAIAPASAKTVLDVAERNVLLHRGLIENTIELPRIDVLPVGVPVDTESLRRAFNRLLTTQLFLAHKNPDLGKIPIQQSRFQPDEFQIEVGDFGKGSEVKTILKPGQNVLAMAQIVLNPQAPLGSVQTFDISNTRSDGELLGAVRVVTILTE